MHPFHPSVVCQVVGVLSTCVLVGSAVAQCAEPILAAGFKLQAAAALLHIIGGAAAYLGLKKFYSETTCRTVAIETSMKSSAFGFLLAKLHFSSFLARVPAAVSVTPSARHHRAHTECAASHPSRNLRALAAWPGGLDGARWLESCGRLPQPPGC